MHQAHHGVVVQAMKQASSMSLSMEKATCAAQHRLRSCMLPKQDHWLQQDSQEVAPTMTLGSIVSL